MEMLELQGGLGGGAPQKIFEYFMSKKNLGYENENKGSRGGILFWQLG